MTSCDILKSTIMLLDTISPSFIIMVEPNLGLVRESEVYRCDNPGKSIRLYFLRYDESMEENCYLNDLEIEFNNFDKLIKEKSNLILPKGKQYNNNIIIIDIFIII